MSTKSQTAKEKVRDRADETSIADLFIPEKTTESWVARKLRQLIGAARRRAQTAGRFGQREP